MKRLGAVSWGLVLTVVLVLSASASASGLPGLLTPGSPHTFTVRPATIDYTGDGSGELGGFDGTGRGSDFGHLKWSSWTASEAVGAGAVWIDDCTPNCAQGKFLAHAVTVRASAPNAGHFTRLTLQYADHGKDITDTRGVQRSGGFYQYYVVSIKMSAPPPGNCQPSVSVDSKIVAVGTCLQKLSDGHYESEGKLRVNGLDFAAAGDQMIRLDVPGKRLTADGTGAIKIGPVPVGFWVGRLDFSLTPPLRFALAGNRSLHVFGFPVDNVLEGTWDPSGDGATLHGSVGLGILGDNVTADLSITADNEHGATGFDIKLAKESVAPDPDHHAGEPCDPSQTPPKGWDCVGTAPINDATKPFTWKLEPLDRSSVRIGGKLPVQGLELRHDITHDDWEGEATLGLGDVFPGGEEGKLLPSFTLGLGIGVNPFQFNFASGEIDNMQVPLPGGVFLQKVKVEVHLHPQLELGGEMKISAGPEIEGRSALAIDAGIEYKRGEKQGFELTINGDVELASLAQLGSAHITYDSTDGDARVSFGGTLGGSWGPVTASLMVTGDVTPDHIQATGNATLQAFGQGATGTAVISDAGFGGCGHVDVLFYHGEIGFKHLFSTGETDFNGCDFSGLYTIGGPARDAAAGATALVRAGTGQVELAALGASAPPDVVLSGPHGERLETPATANHIVIGPQGLALADTGSRTTYFIVQHPAGGKWTISPGASGPLAIGYRRANQMQSPAIHARVTGRGARRRLSWRMRSQPGESVVFLQQGHSIERSLTRAVTRGGHVTFRVSSPSGPREVIALVYVGGLLRERLVVAHFRVSARKLPRPRSATFRLRGVTVTVHWTPVHAASGYEIQILVGHRQIVRINSDARRAGIAVKLPAGSRARGVTVAAEFGGETGRAVTARRIG